MPLSPEASVARNEAQKKAGSSLNERRENVKLYVKEKLNEMTVKENEEKYNNEIFSVEINEMK